MRLPRLPPGRHGLSREYVARNQRQRLAAATIDVVARDGIAAATVASICAAAGVSRRVFYANFESKEDCVLRVYEEAVERLLDLAAKAGSGADDWERQVSLRLRAVLEAFAAEPHLARFCLIAPQRAGGEIAARYRQAMREALSCLSAGRPESATGPSETVAVSLVGGLAALVSRQVAAGEAATLPALLPDLVELFLTPYLGRAGAAGAARGVLA